MKCPFCQVENEDGAAVCAGCGQSFGATLKKGSVVASRYEILSVLGKGGMGMVYKAYDRVLEEESAVKVLRVDIARSPEMARRFRSEIRLARKVTHRNVCRIHEYGEEQGLRYISMELIEGVDLKQVLRERGSGLPADEAFDVAIQIAKGLQAIHEVGIIHRDLKTANLMRDRRGVVKLMDFGIAKEEASGQTSSGTAAGDIVGTPEYMSPEQARGRKVDARSDLYSLAVVIHEVFSGEVPFRDDSPIVTIFRQIQDQPLLEGPGAPPFPPPLVPLLQRGLAKDPEARFASADEMVEALRATRAAFQAETPPPTLTDGIALPTIARPPSPPQRPAGAAAQADFAEPITAVTRTPPPVTPTPRPSPFPQVPAAAPPVLPSLPTPAVAAEPTPAEAKPAETGPKTAPPHQHDIGKPTREQTQRLPTVVIARPPGQRPGEASRILLALMVVAPLVIMGGGVLLVGRLLRPGPVVPTPSPARMPQVLETPRIVKASEAQPLPGPRAPLVAEEVVTVPQPTDPPPTRAAAPEIETRPSPAAARTPSAVVAVQATPRVAAPLATAKPKEPSPEQLRAQQLTMHLAQAEAALGDERYEEAARGFDEALKLDAANARATAGLAQAQWAANAGRRVFALGKTVNAPVKTGKGPAGFETEDVEVKAQDFLCDVAIEMQPAALSPGGNLDYRATVALASVGKKAINVKSIQANVTLNGARSSEALTPLVRSVAPKRRAALAEARGAWTLGMASWSLEIVITGEKGDVCRNVLNWR